ncbi:helix-turn-helix domain-containing protein [Marinobacter subterrani]|uniref:helix-turn-helix domain-containing protein n=1 Tax=Marinobacter subterrani TaxID=1658765 RepID=UPI002356FC94|nr:helix-turn-helix domain-containing protein [Marinobacter subterrani]
MKTHIELTAEQQHDTDTLQAVWEALPAEQQKVSAVAELIGTSEATARLYLDGKIPLNLDALIGFCEYLDIQPGSISPRLTRTLQRGSRLLACPELERLKRSLERGVTHGKLSDADLALLQTTVDRFIETSSA